MPVGSLSPEATYTLQDIEDACRAQGEELLEILESGSMRRCVIQETIQRIF